MGTYIFFLNIFIFYQFQSLEFFEIKNLKHVLNVIAILYKEKETRFFEKNNYFQL